MKVTNHVFHLTDDFAPHSGVTGMISQLSRYLAGQGWSVTILTTEGEVSPGPLGVNLIEFPPRLGGVWQFPKGLRSYLDQLRQVPRRIFHLHGIWMGVQWLAAREALRQGTPALLSPHGMLNSWHLQQLSFKKLKKLIYWHTVAYPAFRHLPLLHAVTPWERDELVRYFPGQVIEVIPNAIDLEELAALLGNLGDDLSVPVEEPYILFLGRLHPVKGVDLLIKAFAKCLPGAKRQFRLLIAGPDSDPAYSGELKSLVRQLGMEEAITFLGPVFGREKVALYRQAWAFCAPSQTEVIGLVNLEAAALGLPVITTHETGLGNWEEEGGVLVHPRVEELSRALQGVFSWSESERQDRGQRLRQLVERRYSWQVVGPQWLELYSQLV